MPTLYFSIEEQSLMPCEELFKIKHPHRSLCIGIPKEVDPCENRVVLTPETVEILTQQGHVVYVEELAGKEANYTNLQYSEAGAFVVNKSEVYQSEMIFKINPPTVDEIKLMKDKQLLFSFLPEHQFGEEYVRRLIDKQVTAISFENIKDKYGCYPVGKIMSEIAGNVSIQIASEYMSKSSGGKGVMLGSVSGVTPSEVIIIGAGTAAEFAARSALGLGAFVRVFDNSVHRLQRLQSNLGSRLYTSVLHPHVLTRALQSADAVICAMHMHEDDHRCPITEEMVSRMKPDTIIIDLSIVRGGCCETSELCTIDKPIVVKHGVIHYCVPNIVSHVPRTASMALSNIMVNIILNMEMNGGLSNYLKSDAGIRNGVYLLNGILTNAYIGKQYNIPFQDIHLLMAAF